MYHFSVNIYIDIVQVDQFQYQFTLLKVCIVISILQEILVWYIISPGLNSNWLA